MQKKVYDWKFSDETYYPSQISMKWLRKELKNYFQK